MKLTRTFRSAGWLAVAGLLSAALIAPSGVAAAASIDGAIWTSLSNGQTVNANIFADKSAVYLNGGPQNCGNNGLPNGDYYFQVTDPSGATLLSSDAIKFRQLQVVNGVISGVSGSGNHTVGAGGCTDAKPVQLMPYADTPNNGAEYSVDMAPKATVDACEGFSPDSATFNFVKDCKVASKNDNFKVGVTTTTSSSSSATTTSSSSTSTTTTVSETTSTSSVASETTSTTSTSTTATTVKPAITPPPTDSFTGTRTQSSDAWRFALVGMAGLLGAILLLAPSAAPGRNKR